MPMMQPQAVSVMGDSLKCKMRCVKHTRVSKTTMDTIGHIETAFVSVPKTVNATNNGTLSQVERRLTKHVTHECIQQFIRLSM